MVTINRPETVCDLCGSADGVDRFRISKGGQSVRADLCRAHRAPIDHILRVLASPSGTASIPVTTMEDIARRREEYLAAMGREGTQEPGRAPKGGAPVSQTRGGGSGAHRGV